MRPSDPHLQRVRDRVRRRVELGGGLESTVPTPGPTPLEVLHVDRAREELEGLGDIGGLSVAVDDLKRVDLPDTEARLLGGGEVGPTELVAYEAIVLGKEYPVFRVRSDAAVFVPEDVAALPLPVQARLGDVALADRLKRVFQGVARLDLTGLGAPYAGTAFVVGPDRLLTNRHVAELFAYGQGRAITLAASYRPRGAFGHELAPGEAGAPQDLAGETVPVTGVEWIHPYWDAALVRVEAGWLAARGRAELVLEAEEPTATVDRAVAVVGYPAFKHTNLASYNDLQRVVFRNVFEVKRFQPGVVTALGDAVYGGGVKRRVLQYDSSTLGGNSGSAVVDLATGRVLGLHFYGDPSRANYAVPAWELARDRIVRTHVVFSALLPAGAPRAAWDAEWGEAPAAEPPAAPDGGGPQGLVAAPPPDATSPDGASASPALAADADTPAAPARRPLAERFGPLWFERANDVSLATLAEDPEVGRDVVRELVHALGADDAAARLEAGRAAPVVTEGATRPRIVYLPGIVGSHLVGVDDGDRSWLDPLEIVFGRLDRTLALDPDGTGSADGRRVSPAGLIGAAYGGAMRRWRALGFEVEPFAYDWRLPIRTLAGHLDAALRSAATGGPVVLACHSMGGVVAAAWAAINEQEGKKDWRTLVRSAVMIGSPLGGSFAPMEVVSGTYGLLRALAAASTRAELPDLQAMGATLWGLLDLLPRDDVFPNAGGAVAALLDPATWTGPAKPGPKLLASARATHALVGSSPIFERSTAILADEWPTVAAWTPGPAGPLPGTTERGDGTVPARSAGLPAFKDRIYVATGHRHSALMNHPNVIEAVAELASGRAVSALARWTRPDAFALAQGATESAQPSAEATGLAFQARAKLGAVTPADLQRLLDPEGEPPRPILHAHAEDGDHAEAEEAPLDAEPSGPQWVERYPGDRTTAGLVQPFRKQVQRFIGALEEAGATIRITATLRPPQRAWLMHYAWLVASGEMDAAKVPEFPGLPINWVHATPEASIAAAKAMVARYGLVYRPAIRSLHTEGRAIDMNTVWAGRIQVRDASGSVVTLDASAGTDLNPALHAVGRGYGVLKLVKDRPHWSATGS